MKGLDPHTHTHKTMTVLVLYGLREKGSGTKANYHMSDSAKRGRAK